VSHGDKPLSLELACVMHYYIMSALQAVNLVLAIGTQQSTPTQHDSYQMALSVQRKPLQQRSQYARMQRLLQLAFI
jgi:hypothetical protein